MNHEERRRNQKECLVDTHNKPLLPVSRRRKNKMSSNTNQSPTEDRDPAMLDRLVNILRRTPDGAQILMHAGLDEGVSTLLSESTLDLEKNDSNDGEPTVTTPNALECMFKDVPAVAIAKTDLAKKEALIASLAPTHHDLKGTLGVMYRGVTEAGDDENFWLSQEYVGFYDVMNARICFPGVYTKRNRDGVKMKKEVDLSKHTLCVVPRAGLADAMKTSAILRLLVNKWPLTSDIPRAFAGFKTIEWDTNGKREKHSMVSHCIRHNPLSKKKFQPVSKTCKCGAILASIAKGLHENGVNPHLKLQALLRLLPSLDSFREKIQKKDDSLMTKELLCYYFRLFVVTNVDGANNSKYAIIGTDQRSSALYESGGGQVGIIPLCIDAQRFIFGKWNEGWGGLQTEDYLDQTLPSSKMVMEERFTIFVNGCLHHEKNASIISAVGKVKLCVWNSGMLDEDTMDNGKQNSLNENCYRRCRYRNIGIDFYARAIIKYHAEKQGGWVVHGDRPNQIPPVAWCFKEWNKGEVLPITLSLNANANTWYQKMGCVRAIFGLSSGAPSLSMEEKQMAFGVQTKIAHHSLRYFWGERKSKTDTMTENVVMKIQGDSAFHGMVWNEDGSQPDNKVSVKLFHATNVTVHALTKQSRHILTGAVETKIGPIPARSDQKFGSTTMEPFAPSTHTLLRVKAPTNDEKSQVLEKVNFLTTGLVLLVNDLLKNEIADADRQTLVDLQKLLATGMIEELRIKHKALGIAKNHEYVVRFDAEYYHSRFDTTVRVRPAPHTEMSLLGLQELQNDEKVFVKYYVIPVGASAAGVWMRFFKNDQDIRGRLIKLEHDSILGYPATAIRETGRISHIEGNPHFLLRIAVGASGIRGLEDTNPDKWDRRCYPHLLDTVKEFKENNIAMLPTDWEKAFRTIKMHPALYVKEVVGLAKDHFAAMKKLCSKECSIFDEMFEI
jgi:hypothetical protein